MLDGDRCKLLVDNSSPSGDRLEAILARDQLKIRRNRSEAVVHMFGELQQRLRHRATCLETFRRDKLARVRVVGNLMRSLIFGLAKELDTIFFGPYSIG